MIRHLADGEVKEISAIQHPRASAKVTYFEDTIWRLWTWFRHHRLVSVPPLISTLDGMEKGSELLGLTAWRRQTAALYSRLRESSPSNSALAWEEFRHSRSDLFRSHPQSPLSEEAREGFGQLAYFPYAPQWRFVSEVRALEEGAGSHPIAVDLPEGRLILRPFGAVQVRAATLTLFWIEAYAGGLFLPFKDGTSGVETYGGGRYLYDTIKGADLGAGPDSILLDFNFAYNPSCAYDPRWVCPLAPRVNTLPFRIEAGELAFPGGR